jgi:hypothetical protein
MRLQFMKLVVFLAYAAMTAGCADKPTQPEASPLAGLSAGVVQDSGGTEPPGPPAAPTPGHFRGTILGHEPAAPGTDTLALFPRLANVRVTAYPVLQSNGSQPQLGPEAASVVTDSEGVFQLPTLAGGEYAVTIIPPQGSVYAGIWVTSIAHAQSADYPWWVVLSRK